MIGLYITLIILAVIGLIILIPIRAVISFAADDAENEIIIRYAFLKFKIYPGKPEEEAGEAETEEKPKRNIDIQSYLGAAWKLREDIKKGITKLLYYTIRHAVIINELNISGRFGFKDAMQTALAAGWINAAVYNVIGLLDRSARLRKWNVSLEPDFEKPCVKAGVYCVVSTNIAHMTVLGVILLKAYLRIRRKIKKNGVRKEQG